jgi:hypothetical protein
MTCTRRCSSAQGAAHLHDGRVAVHKIALGGLARPGVVDPKVHALEL